MDISPHPSLMSVASGVGMRRLKGWDPLDIIKAFTIPQILKSSEKKCVVTVTLYFYKRMHKKFPV